MEVKGQVFYTDVFLLINVERMKEIERTIRTSPLEHHCKIAVRKIHQWVFKLVGKCYGKA